MGNGYAFITKMNQIKVNKEFNNLGSIIAWTLFSVLLISFLIYGLSFFFTKPKIETVTTPLPNTNTYINKTQDVGYSKKH